MASVSGGWKRGSPACNRILPPQSLSLESNHVPVSEDGDVMAVRARAPQPYEFTLAVLADPGDRRPHRATVERT